ncbi:MAG TPA: M48 family metallopeptidase [Verrucomicrobiae bacterium]
MKSRIAAVVLLGLGLVCASLASAETNLPHAEAAAGVSAGDSTTALLTNTPEQTVERFASVPVPEPSEKAVRFYRSGVAWWLASEAWSCFVPAVILFTGCSGWLGRQAKRLGRWDFAATFVFVLLYLLIAYILSFPVSYFRDYVRLHDYGLSNQSFVRWLDHSLRKTVVNVMVFGAVFVVLRELIRRSPRRWWVYCSVFVGGVVFFMAFIYPVWINPLFNRFRPMQDKQLEADIGALAHRAGIDGAHIYEVDKSADTKQMNAYVNGLGSTKRIVLWDTLLAKLDPDELRVVMAHEMGHYVLRHVLLRCLSRALIYALSIWLIYRFGSHIISRLSHRLGFASLSDLGAVPLFLLFVAVGMFLTAPLFNAASRYTEHEADRFALEMTHHNHAAALSFVNVQQQNLGVSRPAFLEHLWRGTHPSLGDRIDFANSYQPWTEGKPGKYEHLFKGN